MNVEGGMLNDCGFAAMWNFSMLIFLLLGIHSDFLFFKVGKHITRQKDGDK